MKTGLLALIFIVGLSMASFGQHVLTNRSQSSAQIWLKGDFRKYKYNLTKTDTTLMLVSNDSKLSPCSVYCSFKKRGNCFFQKEAFSCDTCYKISLTVMLNKKRFKWKQIGTDRYLSKYRRHLLLAGNAEKHYYTLTMLDIKEEDYKRLLGGQ